MDTPCQRPQPLVDRRAQLAPLVPAAQVMEDDGLVGEGLAPGRDVVEVKVAVAAGPFNSFR
jgi:hypothetical protein